MSASKAMRRVYPDTMAASTGGVVNVDIEKIDSPSELFASEYGSETMEQAKRAMQKKHSVDPGLKVGTNARLSHFDNEKLYENDWNNSILDVVEATLLECTESSKGHVQAAKTCRFKHRMLMIPSIVLATAATSASFFAAGDNPCDTTETDDESLKYVVATLTALVGIMSGVANVYNFKAKMEAHIAAAGSFANLARRCKIIIFLPLKLKPQSEVALTDISAEQAHLTNTSPLL